MGNALFANRYSLRQSNRGSRCRSRSAPWSICGCVVDHDNDPRTEPQLQEKLMTRLSQFTMVLCAVFLTSVTTTSHSSLPNPVLYLIGTDYFTNNGTAMVRYRFDVLNKDSYPA